MKKLLISISVLVLMLTGCDATTMDTLSCTYQNQSSLVSATTKYSIDYQGNDVKKVRITYEYRNNDNINNDINGTNDITDNENVNNQMDGVGTGTDGTTNDTQIDNDGIVDGVVGSAIDSVINGISDVILDVSGIRDRHMTVQNTYNNIVGFSTQNVTDEDNNYKVTYVIDFDSISDTDLQSLNLSRDFDTLKSTYLSQGFTCE